jgi:hypothetical protein
METIRTLESKPVAVNANPISAAQDTMHAIPVAIPTHNATAINRNAGIDQINDSTGPKRNA